MEGKDNKNFNNNHGQRHRARDAYEVYEVEHMLHTTDKVSSYNHVKSHFSEKVSNHRFDNGTKIQHYWRPTVGQSVMKNIDEEAEEFIELKQRKWMSMNGY
ncbi:hypothetical protein BUALT_Bualt17G0033700 [Buddleja alternifolia]|uniref:HNH homing endonuclease n=1 Tax=Buddleja alternifolia TaxID=168488 RepID=A0AAV6WGA6_9LAMI|nr:hypothetical protein BUALT_Bualt17G0033700 [Buddleja alternifolia]